MTTLLFSESENSQVQCLVGFDHLVDEANDSICNGFIDRHLNQMDRLAVEDAGRELRFKMHVA